MVKFHNADRSCQTSINAARFGPVIMSRLLLHIEVARENRTNTRKLILLLGLTLSVLPGCAGFDRGQNSAAPKPDLAVLERQAEAAYAKGDWSASEQPFIALTKASPQAVEPWFKLGNIYARTNRYALAVRAYREVVVRDAKHVRAWHNMGVIQLRQAAQTFATLETYAQGDDPLAVHGSQLRQAVEHLLEAGPNPAAP